MCRRMDGRGRRMDNVFIERLWRSLKYEEIYLRDHATIPALEAGLKRWFKHYNTCRPHEALGNLTPHDVHTRGDSPNNATPKGELAA